MSNMCHALVIEDEHLNAMMREDVLVEHGATSVEVATTKAEAARRRTPSFITSDLKLPEATSPRAATEFLRVCGDIPVIFITAKPNDCQGCPPEAIMHKPANPVEIGRRFLQAIRS